MLRGGANLWVLFLSFSKFAPQNGKLHDSSTLNNVKHLCPIYRAIGQYGENTYWEGEKATNWLKNGGPSH